MSGRTDTTIHIKAPMDLVWNMTNDLESWPRLYTEYAKVEILSRDGNKVRFQLTMHPDENGKAHSWVSERIMDPEKRTVRAYRLESHAFDHMDIFWEYYEVDGGVNMRWVQDFHVNDAMSFSDDDMAAHLRKNTAIQQAHIKERIEEAAAAR